MSVEEETRGGTERVEFFRDVDGLWRFRRVAANNEPLAQSEGYQNYADAKATADRIFRLVPWYEMDDGEWKRVKAWSHSGN